MHAMAPIPITVITGFLGSGKTTLILSLLPQLSAANPSYRLALLKNEFGDLAVDSQLAANSAISGVTEILNGCICCNLVGQLGAALNELGETVKPDRIVVETSGSAFPATLALEINRLARETGGRFSLDGVVNVIDVENWKGYEDTSYTARIQAKYTDLIVFNKWEQCDDRRFDECLDRVGDLETDTPWVKSTKGMVPMGLVFGIDGGLAQSLTKDHIDAGLDHKHSHDHHSEVEVLSVVLRGPEGAVVDANQLQNLLQTTPKDEVYRMKALLTASDAVRGSEDKVSTSTTSSIHKRYILNWAFGRWTFTPISATAEHESSDVVLRMTMILARYESAKWKKKLEGGGIIKLDGVDSGTLVIMKIT